MPCNLRDALTCTSSKRHEAAKTLPEFRRIKDRPPAMNHAFPYHSKGVFSEGQYGTV